MKLYKAAHTVYKTQYHIDWITRYRRKILFTKVRSCLETKLQDIRKYYPGWEYIEIGIKKDHVHLLYGHSPEIYRRFLPIFCKILY
ncbi:MAG: transposase [Deltaproteobacteria bacterium]|nr:transposase [Deltaproteobacteria bacterium]